MADLDDLRGLTRDNDEGFSFDPDDVGQEIGAPPPKKSDGKILGLTAGQRAFLSVIMFFIILLFGLALLIVTGRLAI